MKRSWLPAVAGGAALAVGVATRRGRGRDADDRLYRVINAGLGRRADRSFAVLTELGSIWASVGAAAAIARERRREATDALAAAAAMWWVGQVVKRWFARPRPFESLADIRLLIGRPRASSWPSSHPAVLLAFLTVASRDLDAPASVRAAALALAALVAYSRVYLGVHYPADVLGGLLLGRGVADLWSAWMSPRVLGRPPTLVVPPPIAPVISVPAPPAS